ncbi:hypothetical protein BC829DRAFT_448278 [Chytridium lagenaria]|nr:hypothetical protein BC829DRAFT_448278 [Chytridium lagenaria]
MLLGRLSSRGATALLSRASASHALRSVGVKTQRLATSWADLVGGPQTFSTAGASASSSFFGNAAGAVPLLSSSTLPAITSSSTSLATIPDHLADALAKLRAATGVRLVYGLAPLEDL